jgi:hypothetical protein
MPSHYPLTVQYNRHEEAPIALFEQTSVFVGGQKKDLSTMGIAKALYGYTQKSDLASARSDTDIWNHINRYIWGKSGTQSSPRGNWNADPNAIFPQLKRSIDKNRSDNVEQWSKISEIDKSSHTHGNGGGTGEDCGWFGEKCWFKDFKLFGDISPMLILGGVGVGAYLLLKKK